MSPATEAIRKDINKIFGKDVLKYASDDEFRIRRIATGILTLDRILGGGIARARFTEFYGNYSAGKTYSALKTIASAQRIGLRCAFADAEHSFDPEWARKLGVNLEELTLYVPDDGEELIDVVESILRSGDFGLVVVDSIAALIPKKEIEESASKEQMGLFGKMTSKMMRRLNTANKHQTAVILINQVRDKIGVLWGKPETTTGGRAIPFYAGQRVEFRKGEKIKKTVGSKQVVIGHMLSMRVEKDKTGANVEKAGITPFMYKKGIDTAEELLMLAEIDSAVKRSGNTYSFNGTSVTGREKFKIRIRKDKKLRKALRRVVREGTTTMGGEEE